MEIQTLSRTELQDLIKKRMRRLESVAVEFADYAILHLRLEIKKDPAPEKMLEVLGLFQRLIVESAWGEPGLPVFGDVFEDEFKGLETGREPDYEKKLREVAEVQAGNFDPHLTVDIVEAKSGSIDVVMLITLAGSVTTVLFGVAAGVRLASKAMNARKPVEVTAQIPDEFVKLSRMFLNSVEASGFQRVIMKAEGRNGKVVQIFEVADADENVDDDVWTVD